MREQLALPGRDLPESVAIVAMGATAASYLWEMGRLGTPRVKYDEIWTCNGGNGIASGGADGNPGLVYGGGGGGARRAPATSRNGGDGAQGYVRVTYEFDPPVRSFGYFLD